MDGVITDIDVLDELIRCDCYTVLCVTAVGILYVVKKKPYMETVCVCVCGLESFCGCFWQEFANKDEFCEHLVQGQSYLVHGCKLLSTCLSIANNKVKFTREQAMKAQRGSRGIALLFL
jgi:hypothetical protein